MQKRERAMLGTERELRATNIELAAAKTELKRCRRFQSDAEGRCADLVSQLEHWHSEATDARRLASEEVLKKLCAPIINGHRPPRPPRHTPTKGWPCASLPSPPMASLSVRARRAVAASTRCQRIT